MNKRLVSIVLAMLVVATLAVAANAAADRGDDTNPQAGDNACLVGDADCADDPSVQSSMTVCAADATDCADSASADARRYDPATVDVVREEARGLLGRWEADLAEDVRIARRGADWLMLTADYEVGRSTVELDFEDDDWRVTSVTVELPDGLETFTLEAG